MGGWQLEVGKMALYMAFPVGMFHYFNQPEYFEKWVTETKRQIYPPENKEGEEELKKCIRDYRESQEVEMLRKLEQAERNRNAA